MRSDFYLPEPVHDLLASMFHPQGKQRPGTKEVLERLSDIEANLTLEMKSARRKICVWRELTYSGLQCIKPIPRRSQSGLTIPSATA
jgi:hypothetical protein